MVLFKLEKKKKRAEGLVFYMYGASTKVLLIDL